MIVPTRSKGMQPGALRVPFEAERGASVEAFPRTAWERSHKRKSAHRFEFFGNIPLTRSRHPL
jgi:hypothetical protein